MVIAFLIFLMVAEIGWGFIVVAPTMKKNFDADAAFIVGWLLGAFTTATAFVLFYQIFPHEVL